jgi:hypothetical protein
MATTLQRLDFALDERTSVGLAAGGSIAEAITAATAVVLSILGLVGVLPEYAGATAVLAIGVGLLFEGGAIGARFARTLSRHEGDSLTTGDVAGGMTAELIAGFAGIVLGALSLLGFAPLALLPTAALVYAAGLLIGCAALTHSSVPLDGSASANGRRDTILAAAGGQLVVGLAASVLGIVALLGTSTLTLSLVALLAIGASELASGTALGARMMRALRT